MDGTNGFKALAARMLIKEIPKAALEGTEHPMVNALLTLVSEALETWYTETGASFYFAATDYMNAASAAREEKKTEVKEKAI